MLLAAVFLQSTIATFNLSLEHFLHHWVQLSMRRRQKTKDSWELILPVAQNPVTWNYRKNCATLSNCQILKQRFSHTAPAPLQKCTKWRKGEQIHSVWRHESFRVMKSNTLWSCCRRRHELTKAAPHVWAETPDETEATLAFLTTEQWHNFHV